MLKNKFGMTKVLVIVLSVLMLVSLVACNKADGPSTDDMNAAIQAAIDAANAEQAAKEAALAASIAADKAAQEAKDAAVAESLAKEKAENDAALKKAQEEAAAAKKAADEAAKKAADEAAAAKKAADEAAKKAAEEVAAAKKAAEQAADAAAKKAAEEAAAKAQEEAAAAIKAAEEAAAKAQSEAAAALKAAEEAAAKAQAEADRVAAELAAELAAAKAAAEKAAEEAAKAQAEASKAKEEAEKAKEEAANVSSKLDETTVVPPVETTVAPETTTAAPETTTAAPETTVAPETTTEAPVVPVDKTEVFVAYSKLKTEYTYTKMAMFNADDYAELVMLFDKASLDLNNAATVEAATAVLETLKVDVAAVRSVENAAAEVAALVNALGDIETEVFTTQMEKIDEAKKAYTALKKEYEKYFKEAKTEEITTDDAVATELGINVADLNKAGQKAKVLEAYAKTELKSKMEALYKVYNGKISKFDTDDLALTLTYKNDENVDVPVDIDSTIYNAYYIYRVLTVVNGGDLSDANVPTDWEWLVDKKGEYVLDANDKKQYDLEKPTEFFTTEQLMETFILPTLDVKFADYLTNASTGLLKKFEDAAIDLEKKTPAYDVDLDDIVDALEAEFEALSFVEDYKGNATFEDAQNDAKIMTIKAYIEAMGEYLEAAKVVEIENKADAIEALNETIQGKIDGLMDELDTALAAEKVNETKVTNLNNKIDTQKAKIEANKAALVAYTENVKAAALLTFEEMLNAELAETEDYEDTWFDFYKFDETDYADEVADYLEAVLATTIEKNFAEEIKVDGGVEYDKDLAKLIETIVTDLEALRLRVSTDEEDEDDADIFVAFRGTWPSYVTDKADTYEFPNTAAFEEIVAIIDAAIADIEAATTEGVAPKKAAIVNGDKKPYYFKDVNAYNYAVDVHNYAVEADYDATTVVSTAAGLVGTTATAYPVEYLITPAEQVSETVIKAYVQAYQDVNAKIVTFKGMTDLAKNNKYEITHNDKAENYTAYDKIYAAHAGNAALQAEIKDVADIYTKKIDTALTTFANAIAKNGKVKFEVASFYTNNNKATDGNNITIGVDAIKEGTWASKYNPVKNVNDAMGDIVDEFETKFFSVKPKSTNVADVESTWFDETVYETEIDYTNSKVVELWFKKLKGVADLKAAIELYKNTYTPISIDPADGYDVAMAGQVTVDYTANIPYGGYVDINGTYDDDQILTKPADVVAYEAAIDAIFADYSAKIMALTIQSDAKNTVKNGVGTKLENELQINYNLGNAQRVIDAYVKAVAGDANYLVTANNDLKTNAADKAVYPYANSVIFNEFNSIVLKNTYGVTRYYIPVTENIDHATVAPATVNFGSKFTVTVTPDAGYTIDGAITVKYGDDVLTADADGKYVVNLPANINDANNKGITVTATIKEAVAYENVSAKDFNIAISGDPVYALANVTAPKWFAGQQDAELYVTAPNTATADTFGVNIKKVTISFLKADGTAAGAAYESEVNATKYDFEKGCFKDIDVPADTAKVTVDVVLEHAPEYTVTVATGDTNIELIAANANAAHTQTTKGGDVTVKIAAKAGYNMKVKVEAYIRDSASVNATFTPNLVIVDATEYTDVYTFTVALPSTNANVTLVITSVANPVVS